MRRSCFILQADTSLMGDLEDVGPLASVWRSMALHSKYLQSFHTVHNFLLTGDGPLPQVDRHYIAIMVNKKHLFCVEMKGVY